jgi:hypothetical protein
LFSLLERGEGRGTGDGNRMGRGAWDEGRDEWEGEIPAEPKTAAIGDWRIAISETAAIGDWRIANGEMEVK